MKVFSFLDLLTNLVTGRMEVSVQMISTGGKLTCFVVILDTKLATGTTAMETLKMFLSEFLSVFITNNYPLFISVFLEHVFPS